MTPPPGRTALYRIRDEEGALLYIGITNCVPHRWNGHMRVQPWWDDLRSMTFEWFEKRVDAEAAEKAAIQSELPKYNKTYLVPRRVFPRPQARPTEVTPLVPPRRLPDLYEYADTLAGDDGLISLADMARYWRVEPGEMEDSTVGGMGPISLSGAGEDRVYRPVDLKVWMAGHLQGCDRDPVSHNPVTGPCVVSEELEPAARALGYADHPFDTGTPAGRDEIWAAYVACVQWLSDHPSEVAA